MFTLRNANADLFVPDGLDVTLALQRTTHLGISAHQDDLEIFGYHGILTCYGASAQWFTGVVCTDGAGSPRAGIYANYTDAEMKFIRLQEQRDAAQVGKYAAQLQLGYPSSAIKDPKDTRLVEELAAILRATRPEVVYTHNPADKHATHVAVLVATIKALRLLPPAERPKQVYGCEVWRDLDWLPDNRKVVLKVDGHDNLAAALLGVFDSQIAGGKRYDLATLARRRANATFFESHATDAFDSAIYALDLTPVVLRDDLNLATYTASLIDELRGLVTHQLAQFSG